MLVVFFLFSTDAPHVLQFRRPKYAFRYF